MTDTLALELRPAPADPYRGHIDFYGFNEPASGVVFCGWVSHRLAEELGPGEFILRFATTDDAYVDKKIRGLVHQIMCLPEFQLN